MSLPPKARNDSMCAFVGVEEMPTKVKIARIVEEFAPDDTSRIFFIVHPGLDIGEFLIDCLGQQLTVYNPDDDSFLEAVILNQAESKKVIQGMADMMDCQATQPVSGRTLN